MKHFTIKYSLFLVVTPKIQEEFKKIDKFMELLENSGVWKTIESVNQEKEKCKGRQGYNPYNMFAAIIFSFAKFNATLRDIEDKMTFDTRLIYIMEGNTPDHSVIGDFINKYIIPYQYEIFTLINNEIIKELNLNIDTVFLDGTKIEANANKYKFVWKPTKYHKKLDLKIKEILDNIGYNKCESDKLIKAQDLLTILSEYAKMHNIDVNDLPKGRSKKNTIEVKNFKLGYKYLDKLIEYEDKERICGDNRRSYYKTDTDATAMMLKEDYYSKLSNDFHAGYNVQIMVSNFLIMMYGIYQNRTDYYTFESMNNLYYKFYNKYPVNESADSGYGIYNNYKYMGSHGINNYVKFQSWAGESSGKNPQLFYKDGRNYKCLNGKIGKEIIESKTKRKRYKDSILLKFNGCKNCNYAYKCMAKLGKKNRSKNSRIYELRPDYEEYKEQARMNLKSSKGIEIRVNRSIQVEGSFGQIKNNMNYTRFRRRGLEKVGGEIMLMCIGSNIRKFFSTINSNKKIKESYWIPEAPLQNEVFPSVKAKEKKL